MSRLFLVLAVSLALASAGCGYSSRNYMGNGALQITQLMPNSESHGSGDFTLIVTGSGFATGAVVYWGVSPQATTYVSATEVTAKIPAADIANAGMVQVYVLSAGMSSNSLTFTIQ